MQISELFISLGIKGTEKTVNALANVKVGISNIVSTSLEAKAAILATVYALEKLTTNASQDGAHLKNFAAYLGITTEQLQKLRWAAQQGSISNEELEQSLSSLYDKIKQIKTSHKFPEGTKIFSQETLFDITKPFDVSTVLEKGLQFSKNKRYPRETVEKILEDWGFTPNIIGAAMENRFKYSDIQRAPFLKENEISKLTDISVEWANLETKIKMFIGHLTAKDGEEAVKNLSKMADSVFKIANDFERIATNLGVFKLIGKSFEGWSFILDHIADKLEGKKTISDQKVEAQEQLKIWQEKQKLFQRKKDMEKYFSSIGNIFGISKENFLSGYKEFKSDISSLFDTNNNFINSNEKGLSRFKLFENNPSPSIPSRFSLKGDNSNTNINQNIYYQHDGKDNLQIKDSHRKGIIEAYRMFSNSRTT